MHNSGERSAQRPATVVLIALLLVAGIAVLAAGTARATQSAQYKMVACASNSGAPPYTTATNTVSAQHPNGIFDFNNWCGGAGGDPPGDAAFMRISEHEPNGNAGHGAYGQIIFETPWYVHFKSGGGYTREPNAFNAGWLARFRVLDFANNMTTLLNQGSGLPNSGLDWAASGIFGPHLWPFGGYIDFHHFYFELMCNLPGGCDRANYNAVDSNGFVFILNDDSPSQVAIDNTNDAMMAGGWVKGTQGVFWKSSDLGSGMRFERVRVDGSDRYVLDNQARGLCNATSSQTNGEFSRVYQPCPTGGPWASQWNLDTASLSDGAHSLSVCTQDYGQYRGLNGTGGETCDSRTIHVDNHAPGAPAGLYVESANPARYLDHFGARFSLPPDPGSPIAKVHYDVIDAAGKAVEPEHVVSGTNPTEIGNAEGPSKAGDYRLRVWLEDSVGLSGPPATVAIPRDTTPPAAPQDIAVTPPRASRAAEGFDLRWRNVPDAGSPIDAVHYRVLNRTAEPIVPSTTVESSNPQAIEDLDTPRQSGAFTLQLWLSDAEGNVGAPVSVPLSYGCVRSEAGGAAALSAAVSPDGKPAVVLAQGTGVPLSGKLLDANGRGVPHAPLCVFSRVVTDPSPEFLGIAVTGDQGNYSFALPAGASRQLSVTYRPGHREITASAQVATVVKPFFKVRRKVVHNKGVAHFEGWIPGPHNNNVVVVVQVKRGNGWLAFHRYRTREDGHFTIEYRFNRTFRPTLYSMRAQVREQSGYPYLQGTSDPLSLVVLPARHRGR
jgi:hypothetical protein